MSAVSSNFADALPSALPIGESIVWQGRPDMRRLLVHAFHARAVGIYFVLLAAAGLLTGSPVGAAVTLGAGLLCIGVLALLARAAARSSIYTLTDKRLVLRIGMALPMHFNLPLSSIASADYRHLGGGHGEIALRLDGKGRIAWAMLWPHVRAWRLKHPEPMLRAIPDGELVARLLHRCCAALVEVEAPALAQAQPKRRPRKAPAIVTEPAGAAA